MNGLRGKEACEEVFIPGGDHAAEAEGVFAGGLSDEVVGHVPDGGEVGRRMLATQPAFVGAEGHVDDPMQAVDAM